jgi:hypothetical protein
MLKPGFIFWVRAGLIKTDLIPPNPVFQHSSIPTFQYSITPRHAFTAKPISSDLKQQGLWQGREDGR